MPPDMPAMRPPNGVVSDFEHPHGMHGEVYTTLTLSIVLSAIFVWTRLYTRYFIIKAHGWEDYTSFIAWAGLMGYLAAGIVAVRRGAGVHQWDVRLSRFIEFVKVVNVIEIYYSPLIYVTKLSILIQLMRIFVPNHRGKTYWWIHFLIWGNFLFYVPVIMVSIMACIPRAKIWNPTMKGHCVDISSVLIATAAINVVSDLTILVLPIVKIWQLQTSQYKRIGISTIFAAGGFACLSSILRLVSHVKYPHPTDVTYRLSQAWLWTIAEITSGILCGCLPTLPRFFRHFAPKFKKTFSNNCFRGQSQKTTPNSNSWPKSAHETHNSGKSESTTRPDGQYLELRDHAPATKI